MFNIKSLFTLHVLLDIIFKWHALQQFWPRERFISIYRG